MSLIGKQVELLGSNELQMNNKIIKINECFY